MSASATDIPTNAGGELAEVVIVIFDDEGGTTAVHTSLRPPT
ncbi:hypothetical protein [Microbacterium maritypicum]